MKFSMTGQEKGDLLIQVPAWAGLTVYNLFKKGGCHGCDRMVVGFTTTYALHAYLH